MVVLVPDGRDDGGGCRRHGPHEALIAEAQQRLRVAAPASDDDHVDLGVGIQSLQRCERLGNAPVALHGGVLGAESHLRPAQLGVAVHVLLGIRSLAGDEPDHVGEERQRLLAALIEQTLLPQLRAQLLEPLELIAEPHVLHARDGEAEIARLGEVVRLHRRDDMVADPEIRGDAAAHARPDADRDLRVGLGVLEAAEDVAAADVPRGDLALDPHRVPARDEVADGAVEPGDGGGGIGCRVAGRDGIRGWGAAVRGRRLEDGHRVLPCA